MAYSATKKWGLTAAAMVVGVLGMNLALYFGRSVPMILIPAGIIALTGMFVLTAYAYRELDETQRAGQLFAFYWGGSGGLVMAAFVMAMEQSHVLSLLAPLLQEGKRPVVYFSYGFMFACIALVSGFSLAWCSWRVWVSRH